MAGSLLGLQTLQVLQLQPLGLSRVDTGEEGVEGTRSLMSRPLPSLCQTRDRTLQEGWGAGVLGGEVGGQQEGS